MRPVRTVRGQTPAASVTASRRLLALDLPYNPVSTARRQPGTFMHVNPVLPWNLKSEASATSASSVRTGWTTCRKLTGGGSALRGPCVDRLAIALISLLLRNPPRSKPWLSQFVKRERGQSQIDRPGLRCGSRSRSSLRTDRYLRCRSRIRRAPCRSPSNRAFASKRRHSSE
jgi:hypothetical protein